MIRQRTRALIVADPGCGDYWVDLCYDPANPVAVTVVFVPGAEERAWEFARELLDEALAGIPAGVGDVQLTLAGRWLEMGLTSDNGSAVAYLDTDAVRRFLRSTYAVVPRGREVVDVDRMLAGLLGGAR